MSQDNTDENLHLGAIFNTELDGINIGFDQEIALILRWYSMVDGKKKIIEKHFVYANSKTNWKAKTKRSEIEANEVYLEIYDINNRELLNHKFQIQ